nr:uncharacterized protein LOC120972788 [Aegilops tauschii subsp. strangulata]
MQIVVCIGGIWKMVDRALGSLFVDGRCGFLLRRSSRVGVPDLKFDGVSGVLPWSDWFNGDGFTFGEPPWRSAKLYISNGAATSSSVKSSPVFARLAEGHSPPVNFEINGRQYNKGYYLADGIYPQWSTFVKTISSPQGEKRKRFAQMQESVRKDVERAFGVLQSRWGIVQNPALSWDEGKFWEVMTTCVIMHNMIVEDERDDRIFDQGFDYQGENVEPLHQEPATFEQFVQFHRELRDWHTHLDLQNDLVEHVLSHIGNQ